APETNSSNLNNLNDKKDENTNDKKDENINDKKNEAKPEKPTEYALVYYSREPDYCRELIRGSMRNQRRKTVTWKLLQGNVHSPIFMELKDVSKELVGDLFDDIYQSLKEYFGKPATETEMFDLQQRIRTNLIILSILSLLRGKPVSGCLILVLPIIMYVGFRPRLTALITYFGL
ncbi:putative protein RF19 (chloroplast), partial [Trifolium medium]|nr:putative protein RF19 (chloroplast) [Trifolium medium]